MVFFSIDLWLLQLYYVKIHPILKNCYNYDIYKTFQSDNKKIKLSLLLTTNFCFTETSCSMNFTYINNYTSSILHKIMKLTSESNICYIDNCIFITCTMSTSPYALYISLCYTLYHHNSFVSRQIYVQILVFWVRMTRRQWIGKKTKSSFIL